MTTPRVRITVSGGVADYVTDGDVNVELIDYDNEPDAITPKAFKDMDTWSGTPVDRP